MPLNGEWPIPAVAGLLVPASGVVLEATFGQGMTPTDYLNWAITLYSTALAIDSINPQATYTLDNKSVDRNGWREGLQRLIVAIQKTVNALNPYCVVSRKTL